jgi:hypothetical protein
MRHMFGTYTRDEKVSSRKKLPGEENWTREGKQFLTYIQSLAAHEKTHRVLTR